MTIQTTKKVQYPLDKYLKDIFSINYDKYKYYQPNIIEVLQYRIPEINVNKHTNKHKLNIIYSTLLQYISILFYNSSIYLSSLSPLSNSVRELVYLNHMDILIFKNKNSNDNKYIPLLKKQTQLNAQQIHIYSILCNYFNINISDIPNILQLVSFTLTKDKKNIVFYRTDGAYSVFQRTLSTNPSNVSHVVFKIFAYGSLCSVIYSVKSKNIEFLYSDDRDSTLTFDKQVLYTLSTSLFTLNLQYTALNLKNTDDDQFDTDYIFIKDIKMWICICLHKLAPSIDIELILEYINALPYQLRDIFYLNMILFIFEHTKHIKDRMIDYSKLIQELMIRETIHINGIPVEISEEIDSPSQTGGSRKQLLDNKKQTTNVLIRSLFII